MNKHVGLLIALAVVAVTGCSRTPDIDRDGGTVLVYEVDLSDRPRPLWHIALCSAAQGSARCSSTPVTIGTSSTPKHNATTAGQACQA